MPQGAPQLTSHIDPIHHTITFRGLTAIECPRLVVGGILVRRKWDISTRSDYRDPLAQSRHSGHKSLARRRRNRYAIAETGEWGDLGPVTPNRGTQKSKRIEQQASSTGRST